MSRRWAAAWLFVSAVLLSACGSSNLTGSTLFTSAQEVPARTPASGE